MGEGLAIEQTTPSRPAKGTKTLELSYPLFFSNNPVLQYTTPLGSKLISFCLTLVDFLGPLILTEYFLLTCVTKHPLQLQLFVSTLSSIRTY